MAVAKIDIANRALVKLGAEPLTSLSEDNDRAVSFNQLYDAVREATLEAYPWRFALKRAQLAQGATDPTWGWASAFPLPADLLKVESTDLDSSPWTVERGELYSDRSEMKIVYIFNVTDTNTFSPTYVEALSEHLASEMAIAVTGEANLKQFHWELYLAKIKEARTRDSQAGSPKQFPRSDLENERHR